MPLPVLRAPARRAVAVLLASTVNGGIGVGVGVGVAGARRAVSLSARPVAAFRTAPVSSPLASIASPLASLAATTEPATAARAFATSGVSLATAAEEDDDSVNLRAMLEEERFQDEVDVLIVGGGPVCINRPKGEGICDGLSRLGKRSRTDGVNRGPSVVSSASLESSCFQFELRGLNPGARVGTTSALEPLILDGTRQADLERLGWLVAMLARHYSGLIEPRFDVLALV